MSIDYVARAEKAMATRWGADTPEGRFWAKVDQSAGPDGCWIWTGPRTRGGYGKFSGRYTHRVAYELAHGPIPPGLLVCHHCDNPPCVNPDHLYAGTEADNMRDAMERGQWRKPPNPWEAGTRRRRSHCKRGHPMAGDNLMFDYRGWRRCAACQAIHLRASEERRRLRVAS